MRRFVLFLFPTMLVLVSIGLLATVQRSEALRSQMARLGRRDLLEPIFDESAEIAEVTS